MLENMTEIATQIPVEYRMFYARHGSKIQFDADLFNKSVLHVGLCFPKACGESEVQVMAKKIFEDKWQNHLLGQLEYLGTKTLNIRNDLTDDTFVVLLM